MKTLAVDQQQCQIGDDRDRLTHLHSVVVSTPDAKDAAELFRLLGEPTRLRILSALAESGELSVGSIATVVEASETKVSQALRLMRTADVVRNRKEGRVVFYRLSDPHVRQLLRTTVEHVSPQAEASLDSLGTIERISVAAGSRELLTILGEAEALAGVGLSGDRPGQTAARQVSIQSLSELADASDRLGRTIEPDQTRRNITIDGGKLPRARGQRLFIDQVELEVFSDAPPCDAMTEIIGSGAKRALTGRSGIHCRVIVGGIIRVGSELVPGPAPLS